MVKTEFIEISDELFLEIGKMITQKYGIKMPREKKVMFQARLQKRLRELGIRSFDEYALRLIANSGETDEFQLLADFISTNKTEFFRESDHFRFLSSTALTDLLSAMKREKGTHLRIWSAGCSSGQEAFSIAITLEEFMLLNGFSFVYSVVATDISARMLHTAREAIYPMCQVDDVSMEFKRKYFLKSKDTSHPKVRIVKELRDKIRVAYLNLMDGSYPFETNFDVIFLRNTMIYFDQKVQMRVLKNALDVLKTGGYLFIGHSESLINMQLPIKSIAPGVYIKIKL
ncbi:MAG: CheR family methyltransferase [Prolixibacteraceae bacterium]|jgi:chemotaxis protein methyltransferase CheR